MIVNQEAINDLTLGIRLQLHETDADKFCCRVERIDAYRKILWIGLPKGQNDKWLNGIASIFRSLWTASLSCVIAIDHRNWESLLEPEAVRTLENRLPKKNFCIRVYSVPNNSPLNSAAQMSDFVKDLYNKERRTKRRHTLLEMG